MGVLKYDCRMTAGIRFRVTSAQANSLNAMADAMSLTVGDTIRAAVDQFFEDIPDEPRLFTRRVHLSLGHQITSPTRRR